MGPHSLTVRACEKVSRRRKQELALEPARTGWLSLGGRKEQAGVSSSNAAAKTSHHARPSHWRIHSLPVDFATPAKLARALACVLT